MENSKEERNIRGAFDDVFGTEDKYFGEWFISADESLTDFLENNLSSKEIFFKQMRYLYLYFESLEILKTQAEEDGFGVPKLMSRDAWYCTVLLMLVGLIDQHTKQELDTEGKQKRLKNRFQSVLNSLDENEKKDFLMHYHGNKFKKFDDLTSHLYGTRTFFAHDLIMPRDAVPQDGYLGVSTKKVGTLFINMPHGRIFLKIVIALLRYLGFKGELKISSNKEFKSFSDMMRKT